MAGAAEPLAGRVAHHLVALGVHDDDAVLERRHRPRQRLALDVAVRPAAVRALFQVPRDAAKLASK